VRLVLDTNIIVSAVVFGGKPREVLDLCIKGRHLLVTCAAIIAETESVLTRPKFGFPTEAVRMITAELLQIAELAEPKRIPSVIPSDPDDDMVLACAVTGKADAIVSGDRHLTALGTHRKIPILDAAGFLTQWV
jgi:uncharacterized protein